MDTDLRTWLIVVAIAITVVLWLIAIALGRVDVKVTLRGLRNGLLIAAVIFVITAVIVTFVFNGRAVFADSLDLGGAFALGLIVGAVLAAGYLLLGVALIAIGLLFRSKPQWTTLGAWAAVPIIIVSAGFGYAAYRSVGSEGPPSRDEPNGSISLAVIGLLPSRLRVDGTAICSTDSTGTLHLVSGDASDAHVISTDGRPAQISFTLDPTGTDATIQLDIYELSAVPNTVVVAPGSTYGAGKVTIGGTDSVPWTGTFSWSCSR